jgi:hypothetical protein
MRVPLIIGGFPAKFLFQINNTGLLLRNDDLIIFFTSLRTVSVRRNAGVSAPSLRLEVPHSVCSEWGISQSYYNS